MNFPSQLIPHPGKDNEAVLIEDDAVGCRLAVEGDVLGLLLLRRRSRFGHRASVDHRRNEGSAILLSVHTSTTWRGARAHSHGVSTWKRLSLHP